MVYNKYIETNQEISNWSYISVLKLNLIDEKSQWFSKEVFLQTVHYLQ